MKKLITLLFLLLSVSTLFSQTTLTAKVVGIKDGDTVVVLDSLNNQTTLRLAEVDCPEKSQPFGTKAKQFTSDQIYLKTIKYVVTDTDSYGRSIRAISKKKQIVKFQKQATEMDAQSSKIICSESFV